MRLFLILIFILGSFAVDVPDIDVSKCHEFCQGEAFQTTLSVFRKTERRKVHFEAKQSALPTGGEKFPSEYYVNPSLRLFSFSIPSPVSFHLLNPHTLPLPPPLS